MPIYISKKAIDNIPVLAQNITTQDSISPRLRSTILKSDGYLNKLSRNDMDRKPLKQKNDSSTYDTVRRLKGALEAIAYFESGYVIPGNIFVDRTGDYDSQMAEAVMVFQSFAGLPVNGVINSETLFQIDSYFNEHNAILTQDSVFLGKGSEKEVPIIQEPENNSTYDYSIVVDGFVVAFYTNDPLRVKPIIKESNQSGLFYAIIPDETRKYINEQKGSFIDSNITEFAPQKITTFDGFPFEDNSDILTVLNSIPPQKLSNNDAHLYKISPGDKLSDIVISNYYNSAVDILDPYTDELIYQLPIHGPSSPQDRPDDIRFKFYLNLLYYYNIDIDKNGIVTEYGIKAATGQNQYNRYDDERLDNYNIYDNTFSDSDPDSVFPNYYRFLKFMAEQPTNPTDIVFDSEGNPVSFTLDSTKHIWIPDRKFADALFYQLNFRHDEMLTENQNSYEYLSLDAMSSVIQQMIQKPSWNTLTNFAKGLFVEIYNETLEFYRKMYNFAITSLAQFFPRGLGMYLEGNVGATWGYPISTDIGGSKVFWRKMTSTNELTFMMQEEVSVGVGIDIAVGYNAGFKLGKGKKQKNIGFKTGAGIQAEIILKTKLEYEFPIRQEETGLINFLLSFTNATRTGADILGALNVTNVSPQNYLTSSKMAIDFQTTVWAAAQAGFTGGTTNTDNNITLQKVENQTEESKNNSFLSIDNIPNKVSSIVENINIGGSIVATFVLGTSFEYKAVYDNKPLVHKKSGRVPSEVEVTNSFSFQGTLTTEGLGGLLEGLLGTIILGPLSLLNFDNGIELAITNKYKRATTASAITFNDTKLDTGTLTIPSNSPELRYNQGKWETLISVSRFTGAPDTLCTPGTQAKLTLNASKLIQLIVNGGSGPYNFPNLGELLDIFDSYSYLYKTGFGYNSTQKLGLVGSAYEALAEQGGGIATGVTREFLKRANSDSNPLGIDAYLGFYVGAKLKISEAARKLIEYFMKHIYISSKIELPAQKREYERYVNNLKTDIGNSLTSSEKHTREAELYAALNDYFRNDNMLFKYRALLNTLELKDVFKSMLLVYRYFNIFLAEGKTYLFGQNQSNVNNDEKEQLVTKKDAQEIFRGLVFIAELLNVSFALEARLGIAASGEIKAGEGATVRIALGGAGGLMAQMKFMDEEEGFIEFTDDDPYRKPFDEIEKLLFPNNYSETGIRKSFLNTP